MGFGFQPMKDKLAGIAGGLKDARPKLGLLGTLLGGLLNFMGGRMIWLGG